MPSGDLTFPEIADVYARFVALTAMSRDLGGWLLLYAGLDCDGIAVAMASNVAGAGSLGIESDATRAKQALRAGVCDFVVNNLDEALRILKNEIRKRRPASVVLTAEADAAIAEIVERGVQPEILSFPVRELMERGARVLETSAEDGPISVHWSVAKDALRWLPVVDALAVASLKRRDARIRWIEAAPRYLGRAFAEKRYLQMTNAEAEAFIAATRDAVRIGTIAVAVSVTQGRETMAMVPSPQP